MARMSKLAGLSSASLLGLALALAACSPSGTGNQAGGSQMADTNGALPALPAAVPLQQGSATAIAPAPAAGALPAARPMRVAQVAQPSDAYAYLDRANGVADAIGDAPPDYAYDDGDVSPWAWQTGAGDVQYAEPVQGGYRYYYYQPGADAPYLVRDPSYSYAYADDQLVAVYDDRGALLPPDAYRGRADYAARYYARASYLYRLAGQREHRGVIAANWAARRAEIAAARAQWSADRAGQAEWQAYHDAHAAQEQEHWAEEREQRLAQAQHFDRWQRSGFDSPPPPPSPPGRPASEWARDDRGPRMDAGRQQMIQQQQRLEQARREGARQAEEQARQQQAAQQAADQHEQWAQQRQQAAQYQQSALRQQAAHEQRVSEDRQRAAQQALAAQRAADRAQAQAGRQREQAAEARDRAMAQRPEPMQAGDRQHLQAAGEARVRAAEQQQQQRAEAQAEARQRQSEMRAQAAQVHEQPPRHAEAAQRAQTAERAVADARPPAPHTSAPAPAPAPHPAPSHGPQGPRHE